MTITTLHIPTLQIPHIYEFEVKTWHGNEEDYFSTTFVSRYVDRTDADDEARDAARRWLTNLHQTVGEANDTAKVATTVDYAVHIRTGDFTWYNESETELQKQTVRFVDRLEIG